MDTQASRIIKKLGGAQTLANGLGYSKQAVYRWDYPKTRGGSGGLIPTSAVRHVKSYAERVGIELTPRDWEP